MHRKIGIVMKQQYAVVALFALIIASSMVSLTSYKRAVRQCQRLRSKANPDAAADGDAVAVAIASVVESRDLRCPLAQETRCQRDTLHAYTTTEAHHRRTFRP